MLIICIETQKELRIEKRNTFHTIRETVTEHIFEKKLEIFK